MLPSTMLSSFDKKSGALLAVTGLALAMFLPSRPPRPPWITTTWERARGTPTPLLILTNLALGQEASYLIKESRLETIILYEYTVEM